MKAVLIFLCLVCFSLSSNYPFNIIGITYDTRNRNNSIVLLDAASQKLLKAREVGNVVFKYGSSGINLKERQYYLVNYKTLTKIDVDSLEEISEYPIDMYPTEAHFDEIWQQFVAIDSESWTIKILNVVNGTSEPLIEFSRYWGIYIGSSAYDSRNHRYWLCVSDHSNDRKYVLVQFDLVAKKIVSEIPIPNLIKSMRYDYRYDRLIGINGTEVVSVNPRDGKIIPIVQTFAGLPGLHDAMFDSTNQLYFYGATNFGNYSRAKVNVQTRQFTLFPTWNNLKHTHFIPKK